MRLRAFEGENARLNRLLAYWPTRQKMKVVFASWFCWTNTSAKAWPFILRGRVESWVEGGSIPEYLRSDNRPSLSPTASKTGSKPRRSAC